MNIPEELRYTADHEWIRIEGDLLIVGITDFAQSELGEIIFVEVDTLDSALKTGDQFGTVEAVKTVSDLFMPVDGEVVEVNEALGDDAPEKVNEDPYGEGWIIKIKLAEGASIDHLLDAAAYAKATTS